jgi:hypothetical protein
MEFNWSILGWIAGLLFVYIFGLFEGRSQGRKRRIAEEQEEKKKQPASPPATAAADDPGLLRIKNKNGTLTLDLDGARVDATSLSPDQRKRLIELLSLMRPWLEGKPAPAAPPSSPAPSAKPMPVSSQQETPAPTAPVTPQTAPLPATPASSSPKAKKDDKPAAPVSIVEQINEILQNRIMNTGLASRGVTLLESPSGGVNVYVGIEKYEGIDSVPDEEVKTAIRAAIAEWEKKYTPGLS